MDGPETASLSPWFLPRRCCYSLRIYDDGSSRHCTVLVARRCRCSAAAHYAAAAVRRVEWRCGACRGGWWDRRCTAWPSGHVRNVQSRPLHDRHHSTVLCCSIIYSLPPPAPSAALPFRFTVSCRCEMWTMRANIYISHRGGSVRSIGGLLGSFCPCHHLIRPGHCAMVHHVRTFMRATSPYKYGP